ncbi:MAG TPA: hypothetical protein VGZ52_06125 [Acidimicrobiales bacterium]|jgi:lipoate-protein ligase A|nr:hypothetical protein [Acidimicrobiales bacterium]
MSWRVERARGTATDFHGRDLPVERGVWIFDVEHPALVLGSTQPQPQVAAPDIEVVRRRSGGGAVFLDPGRTLWVDVVVPRGDDFWDDDVGRATHWLGERWAGALGGAARVHRGAMVRTAWSDVVCFAGLGPGEVTIGGDKVVGISQRRTRDAARFQCVAYEVWDDEPLLGLLGLRRTDVSIDAVGVGVGRLTAVADALLAAFA